MGEARVESRLRETFGILLHTSSRFIVNSVVIYKDSRKVKLRSILKLASFFNRQFTLRAV